MNFEFWINGKLSKIGHHFSNKSFLRNLENVNNQKCASKLIFFKKEKDSNDFWHKTLTWKSNFGTFWHLRSAPILEIQKFFWVCLFLGKNLSNFVPPVWKLHNPYCHIGYTETRKLKLKTQIFLLLTFRLCYTL